MSLFAMISNKHQVINTPAAVSVRASPFLPPSGCPVCHLRPASASTCNYSAYFRSLYMTRCSSYLLPPPSSSLALSHQRIRNQKSCCPRAPACASLALRRPPSASDSNLVSDGSHLIQPRDKAGLCKAASGSRWAPKSTICKAFLHRKCGWTMRRAGM